MEDKTRILNGHKRPITSCCFRPKTLDLISVSKDGSVIIFVSSLEYKRFVINHGFPKSMEGHAGEILACDISFDGKYLVTGGKDHDIKIWNLDLILKEILKR